MGRVIPLMERNLREFPNPSLLEELEYFFRWLDTEVCPRDFKLRTYLNDLVY